MGLQKYVPFARLLSHLLVFSIIHPYFSLRLQYRPLRQSSNMLYCYLARKYHDLLN